MTSLTDSATGQFGFGYDALSRRTSLTRPNGVNTAYSYDNLSRLLSVLHQAGTNTIDGAAYTYDNAGLPTSKTAYINSLTEHYTYDPIYQLTQVTQGLTTTESYSYDPVGNRLSSLGMAPYGYNSSNQLLSTPAATYTYDANGNTLTKSDSNGTTTYGWDIENRLSSVTLPGMAGTVTFKYDPLGRRVQKTSLAGSINYLYDMNESVATLDNVGLGVAHYVKTDATDESLSEHQGSATTFYEQDGLGSITSMTDLSGSILQSDSYNAFGKSQLSAEVVDNPLHYIGRDYDSETGLYYFRHRYYDPSVGRFLQEDPSEFLGGLNFYGYAENEPTDLVDPWGTRALPKLQEGLREGLTLIEGTGKRWAGRAVAAAIAEVVEIGGVVLAYPVSTAGPLDDEPGVAAHANEIRNCDPRCAANLARIYRLINEVEGRINDMLVDVNDLFNQAYAIPVAGLADGTTWLSHQGAAEDAQRGLRDAIRNAEKKGCPIPPMARPLAARPIPKQPRGNYPGRQR